MYVIEISCWWSKEPCKCLVFITGFIDFMKGLSENEIQIWCRCLFTRWKTDQRSWCRNYVIDFNEMYSCNSFSCPTDKALVKNGIIKFCCSYLGLAVIIINQTISISCWRVIQCLTHTYLWMFWSWFVAISFPFHCISVRGFMGFIYSI